MSIANYLTFIRVFISPIFLLVYLEHEALGISWIVLPYILIVLVAVSELSDAFDGYIARKYNQVTDLGKILDPMADSISRISMFLTFTQGPVSLPLILVFVFIYRDSVVSTLRTVCALRGFALAARPSGKIKAVIQAIVVFCILILLIPYTLGHLSQLHLQQYSLILVFIAAVYSFFSGIDYIYANREYIKKLLILKKI
ncbi:MAG: CDP-diacylglycerol--glycerol-3-phosphate 3-phosphatidyltransferase [Parachlamydiales bacterium]|nr:CDP-diacylglycerol--glycerol-3-phosphate 3-phosphatidyltransferase [Parachlamydiales bacterium]